VPLERPRLKGHLTAEFISASRVFVVGEGRAVMLDRELDVALLPLLDGQHTFADIAGQLAGRFSIADVFRCVAKLDALGLLLEGHPPLAPRELAYWDAAEVDAGLVAAAIPSATTGLVAIGRSDPDPFEQVLKAAGIRTRRATPQVLQKLADCALVIVLTDDYLAPELADINQQLLAGTTPWLLVKTSGVTAWLGPLLQPGETGCWRCLYQRVNENRQVERYLKGRRRSSDQPFVTSTPEPPQGATAIAAMLVPDVIEILATGRSTRLSGTLITLDRLLLATQTHTLIKQPQCPACGDPTLLAQRDPRVELAQRLVQFSADGGYRTEPPEQTLERLRKHISPILGAVTTLTSVTESAAGVTHAYAAGHNFAQSRDNMLLLKRNLRGQSGGKGRSDVQARVSAVAEAIERYSGVWRGEEPVRRATFDELEGEHRIHVGDILLFSEHQYDTRAGLHDELTGRYNVVPHRFPTDMAVDWTATWSLTHNRPVLVPAGQVWFGHPDIESHFFTYSDGNGNASGSVREEAILQAACELIERDSVAIWWYNRLRRPGFDLDSLDDPYVETLRRYYRSLDREFWVIDITTDLGIPTFAAVSRRVKGSDPEDVILGFGCHIDPGLAAMRALTEMSQFLPVVARRRPDGSTLYLEDDPVTLEWWRTVRVADEPWLLPSDEPASNTTTHAGLIRETLTDDIAGLLERLHETGLEVLVADQTRPDLDLSVVKVIVPGLRHFWRRLGPGRLYDVPVKMGWLSAPLQEDQLNPKSVFF
jgi:bacteriocin biosynthesis cyclodehydratase domain-containing protein